MLSQFKLFQILVAVFLITLYTGCSKSEQTSKLPGAKTEEKTNQIDTKTEKKNDQIDAKTEPVSKMLDMNIEQSVEPIKKHPKREEGNTRELTAEEAETSVQLLRKTKEKKEEISKQTNNALDTFQDPKIRCEAISALIELDATLAAIPVIILLLEDYDALVRSSAISALASSGVKQAIPEIILLLEDKEPSLRIYAANVLVLFNVKEAIPKIKKLLQDDEKFVRDAVEVCLRRLGLTSEEIEKAKRPSDKTFKPQTAQEWCEKGQELHKASEYDEAIKAYDKAIELNPKYIEAWSYKGIALYALKKYEETIEAFDHVIELDPKDARAWFGKADSLFGLGKYESAITAFDKAMELLSLQDRSSKNLSSLADIWYNKGLALFELGKYKEAVAAYDKSVELKNPNPNEIYVYYARARAYAQLKDKPNALANLTTAIDGNAGYKETAKGDKAFQWLWDDDNFKKLTNEPPEDKPADEK
jgi:tetratricopeptide (TPR) repeat protein